MFCNRCGGEIAPTKVLCQHCGAQIPPEAIRMSTPVAAPARVQQPPATPADKHAALRAKFPDLQGVGGWLGIFAWTSLVLSPLVYFTQSGWPPTYWISWTLFGSIRIYGAVVGYLIIDESPYAFLQARIQLCVQLGIYLLVAGYEATIGMRPSAAVLRMIFGTVIWLLYFAFSARVKLTLDPPRPKRL